MEQKQPVYIIPVAFMCAQLSLAQRPQHLITCRHITDTCHDLWGPFTEMHRTYRSGLGYKSGTRQSRAPTHCKKCQTIYRKHWNKTSVHWMWIMHSCSLTTALTKTHTHTHRCYPTLGCSCVFCCFLPKGFIPPSVLSVASRGEEKKKRRKLPIIIFFRWAELHCIHFCLCERFCLPDDTFAKKKPNAVSKHILTLAFMSWVI